MAGQYPAADSGQAVAVSFQAAGVELSGRDPVVSRPSRPGALFGRDLIRRRL